MAQVSIQDLPHFSDIKIFRNMAPSEIQEVLSGATTRRFSRGSLMSYQGDRCEHFYLLSNGRARYFYQAPKGKKLILRWIIPGQVFGVAALVPGSPLYLVSSEAVQDSAAMVWSSRTIRGLASKFPRLLENALVIATDYMTWYVTAHAGLTSHTARERLTYVLIELAETVGHKLPQGVELDVTNEELASAADITPYTASRMISGWRSTGAIRKKRGKLVVRSMKLLLSQAPSLSQEDSQFPA